MRNLGARLEELEQVTPGGYRTFDTDGNIVIDSPLPPLEWFSAALNQLSNGSLEEREILKSQLRRSVRARDGGRLWEFALASTGFAYRAKDGELLHIQWDDLPALRAAAQARSRGEQTDFDALFERLTVSSVAGLMRSENPSAERGGQ